eukprot:TRINITY_DN2650_c0_g2_i1.p1 TRINITY_DN2650_c0_g2~~TRINITY_DN2650_c0_g2_i1.p1  ORF type:complete len:434 (-),score=144.88 TRINITY_DN2650_c0_g2_i1:56-1357(-)
MAMVIESKKKLPTEISCDVESFLLLRKMVLFVVTWQRVYCVLSGDNFCIYKAENNNTTRNDFILGNLTLENSIRLDDSFEVSSISLVSVTGKKHAFSISSSKKDLNYMFCANNEEEKGAWVIAIENYLSPVQLSITGEHEIAFENEPINIINIPTNQTTNTAIIPIENNLIDNISIIPEVTAEINSFSLATYNLNYALCVIGTLPIEENSIVEALISCQADIVCLQETSIDWEFFLKTHQTLKQIYKYFLFQAPGNHSIPAGGIGIISKFPISSCKSIESPVRWFPAHLYEISVPNPIGVIQVLNLHLRPPLTESALPLLHAYVNSKSERVKEVLFYSKYIDFKKPIIVCGDFNEGINGASVQFWIKNMLMNHCLKEHKSQIATWHWKLPGGLEVSAQFDHMFYANLLCKSARCIHSGVSDHYPVVAEFTRKS